MFGETKRYEALAQHVLHRLTEPEIDPEGQRGHELGESHATGVDLYAHERTVPAVIRAAPKKMSEDAVDGS